VLEFPSHALTERLERPACELSTIVTHDEFWGPEAAEDSIPKWILFLKASRNTSRTVFPCRERGRGPIKSAQTTLKGSST